MNIHSWCYSASTYVYFKAYHCTIKYKHDAFQENLTLSDIRALFLQARLHSWNVKGKVEVSSIDMESEFLGMMNSMKPCTRFNNVQFLEWLKQLEGSGRLPGGENAVQQCAHIAGNKGTDFSFLFLV